VKSTAVVVDQDPVGKSKETEDLAREVVERCRRLASYSEDADRLRRTFLSAPMREVHQEIASWLRPLEAEVRVDAAGNLRASYAATAPGSPRLLIGSHLDTVPNAGAFDGVLGVVLAVALLEGLAPRKLPFAIEVVGFSEEEGVRFGKPFIGSRALVSRLDEDLLSTRDAEGASVRKAISDFGLDPAELPRAVIGDDVFAFLEFHIEQGPLLESLGQPLGVPEAVAGQTRMDFVFLGRANHAGTTPMDLRRDAMTGAAEWITGVEAQARGTSGLVATVGSVQTIPGATNVIAGEARLTLDVRHASDSIRARAVRDLTELAENIARRRGLNVGAKTHLDQRAVAMDQFLMGQIAQAIEKTGSVPHRMVSGAGHDAMILAEKIPVAMVFLRTPGGISHDPAESVEMNDVAKAIECGLYLLEQLVESPSFLARAHRA
jgi:allantoate deiminase